jgi:chaperonin GroES
LTEPSKYGTKLKTFIKNQNRRIRMKIQPLDDRVLVQPIEEVEKVGSIIIPDTAKEKPSIGKVIAVGTDEDLKKLIKVGDKVLFGKYAGEELKIDGEKHLIISKADLLAKAK